MHHHSHASFPTECSFGLNHHSSPSSISQRCMYVWVADFNNPRPHSIIFWWLWSFLTIITLPTSQPMMNTTLSVSAESPFWNRTWFAYISMVNLSSPQRSCCKSPISSFHCRQSVTMPKRTACDNHHHLPTTMITLYNLLLLMFVPNHLYLRAWLLYQPYQPIILVLPMYTIQACIWT